MRHTRYMKTAFIFIIMGCRIGFSEAAMTGGETCTTQQVWYEAWVIYTAETRAGGQNVSRKQMLKALSDSR